jgi:rhodanese-related sulfurtransferase
MGRWRRIVLRSPFSRPGTIDAAEAAHRLDLGEIVLVDVREPGEWRAVRAAGAQHVPLATIPRALSALAAHGKPVAFICRSGSRSAAACAAAHDHGIEPLNVGGGMGAWQRAGLPVTSG